VETLKKIVSNQYFPAAAVLTAVVLFWTIAMFGGLSLLHNNQPPMATLTWMLFVYAAAVLTPLAGIIAAADLIRRWRRNRQYAQVDIAEYESAGFGSAEYEAAHDANADPVAAQYEATESEPAEDAQAAPEAPEQAAAPQPAQQRPATHQPAKQKPQPKQRKTAA
jgi:hypothetical protein